MKTLTNEMIFEKLGWRSPGGDVFPTPDPLHDLNDAFKYVWFAMSISQCRKVNFLGLKSPEDAATAICKAFMDLP